MSNQKFIGMIMGGILSGYFIFISNFYSHNFSFSFLTLGILIWVFLYYHLGEKTCNFCGEVFRIKENMIKLDYINVVKKTTIDYYLKPKIKSLYPNPDINSFYYACKSCHEKYLKSVNK